MKKWIKFMGAGTLVLGLAACGDTAEPVDGSEENSADDGLTLEEVFNKSTEATEEINSLHADMTTAQLMTMGAEGMEMEIAMDIGMDMTVEPLAFHQTAETSILSDDIQNEESMAIEMYYTEEGLFTYEPMMDMWMKMPADSLGEMQDLINQESADPSEQLEQLHAFQDDFTFEQSADEYILTLDASGEEFKELLDQQLEQTLGQMDMGAEAQTFLEDMEINSANYEIFIDKETFLTNSMNVKMNMDMNIEGETMNIKSDMQTEYSQYDEIEAITVPDEVQEQAQEISF